MTPQRHDKVVKAMIIDHHVQMYHGYVIMPVYNNDDDDIIMFKIDSNLYTAETLLIFEPQHRSKVENLGNAIVYLVVTLKFWYNYFVGKIAGTLKWRSF